MTTFVDTSVLVSVSLGTEANSEKAKKALEEWPDEDVAVDTTILTETFLVLRSKVGTSSAASRVQSLINSYAYFTVAKTVVARALATAAGSNYGDALIVEQAKSIRARLLTLDEKQGALYPEGATVIK